MDYFSEDELKSLDDAQAAAEVLKKVITSDNSRTKRDLGSLLENAGVKDAHKRVASFLSSPDTMLLAAGALMLYGNAAYVVQHSKEASISDNVRDQVINALHAAIFASFTLEKIVDISKSGLSMVTKTNDNEQTPLTRRSFLKSTSKFLENNYAPIAGAWLSSNQIASTLTFFAQAQLGGGNQHYNTASTRALASAASISMTLYKYHAILEKEEETGKKILDDRIREKLEIADKLFGGGVRLFGGLLPYISAVLLTGPHVNIFINKYYDKKNPSFSTPSVATGLGYLCFVGYLASGRHKPLANDHQNQASFEADFQRESTDLQHTREVLEQVFSKLSAHTQPLTQVDIAEILSTSFQDAMSPDTTEKIASNLVQAFSTGRAVEKSALAKAMIYETIYNIIDERFPMLGRKIGSEIRANLASSLATDLIDELATPLESLEGEKIAVTNLQSRRGFFQAAFKGR